MARPRRAAARAPSPGRAGADLGRLVLFLTLLACPLLFSTSTLEAFEFTKVLLLRAVALVFAGLGIYRIWRALAGGLAGARSAAWRDPLSLAVVALLAAGAASSAASISPPTSLRGGHETFAGLFTLASYAVLFFSIRALCREPRHPRELLPAVGLAVAGASGYALLQVLGLDPVPWTRKQEFLGLWRAQGTLGNPTFLGGFLAVALPLVAALALAAARRRAWQASAAWTAVGALGIAGLGVTLARGAWLALACGAVVTALGLVGNAPSPAVRRRVLLAGTAVLVLAVLGVALSPPARRVVAAMAQRVVLTVEARPQARPAAGLSYQEEPRLALWRVAFALWREHPWLGVGLDAFQLGYPRHRSLEVWRVAGHRTPQNAHNELLQTLATQGLAGGLALLAAAIALGLGLRAAWRRSPGERLLLSAVAGSLVAAVVHLSFSLTVAALGLLLVFLAALVARLAWGDPPAVPLPALPGAGGRALLAACVLLVLAGEARLVLWPLRADLAARAAQAQEVAQPGAGLGLLRQAVALDPGRDLLWSRLGAAAFGVASVMPEGPQRAAFLLESRQAFERAQQIVPVNAYHHQSRARVLLAQAAARPPAATPEEVRGAFDEALRLDPRNPYIAAEAGRAALQLRDTMRVREIATRCLAADELYGACEWLLANLDLAAALAETAEVERQRLFAAAAERLARASSLLWYEDDTSQALCASQGAAAFLASGRLQEGKHLAELAVAKDPRFPDARYNLGKAWERLGDLAQAEAAYRATLAVAPGHREAAAALRALRQAARVP